MPPVSGTKAKETQPDVEKASKSGYKRVDEVYLLLSCAWIVADSVIAGMRRRRSTRLPSQLALDPRNSTNTCSSSGIESVSLPSAMVLRYLTEL